MIAVLVALLLASKRLTHRTVRRMRRLELTGTLRFLVLAALAVDPEATGVICLEEPENGLDAPEPDPAPRTEVPQVVCPSCGTHNPNYNRHCEACGARLTKGPLPVAPPPLIRATPGSRASIRSRRRSASSGSSACSAAKAC